MLIQQEDIDLIRHTDVKDAAETLFKMQSGAKELGILFPHLTRAVHLMGTLSQKLASYEEASQGGSSTGAAASAAYSLEEPSKAT